MLSEVILLNIYYAGNAIAFLIRDIFWLRVVLILAGFTMIARGILIDNNVIVGWVSLFTIINIIQVINLINKRRDIKLEATLDDIYKTIFYDMTKREFLFFWNKGESKTFTPGTTILEEGKTMKALHFVVSGKLKISKGDNTIARLSRNNFIGEMSYLSSMSISADVIAENDVTTQSWSQKALDKINIKHHYIYNKFHLILSKDLIAKLQRYL